MALLGTEWNQLARRPHHEAAVEECTATGSYTARQTARARVFVSWSRYLLEWRRPGQTIAKHQHKFGTNSNLSQRRFLHNTGTRVRTY